MSSPIVKFAGFNVTSQVFYKSALSFSIVNIRPILPGHVLVCPLRPVARFNQLTADEVCDFFLVVQRTSKMIEQVYKADSLNIAIQDGPQAGQSVPHLHCHIIPRKLDDLENVDDIYDLLNKFDLDSAFRLVRKRAATEASFRVDNDRRTNRTEEDMASEARELRKVMNYIPE